MVNILNQFILVWLVYLISLSNCNIVIFCISLFIYQLVHCSRELKMSTLFLTATLIPICTLGSLATRSAAFGSGGKSISVTLTLFFVVGNGFIWWR